PASNAVTDARSLARMYAAVGSGDLVKPELNDLFSIAEPLAVAAGVPHPMAVGYHLVRSPARPDVPGQAFGHGGAGGTLGFADPQLALGFGYVKNRMLDGAIMAEVVAETYRCLAAAPAR